MSKTYRIDQLLTERKRLEEQNTFIKQANEKSFKLSIIPENYSSGIVVSLGSFDIGNLADIILRVVTNDLNTRMKKIDLAIAEATVAANNVMKGTLK